MEPQDAHNPFIAWLFRRAGLKVNCYRSRPLERRLRACLRALRASSVEHAREMLEKDPALLSAALGALLLGVTEFFRDPPVFANLKRLIPELAGDRGGLRVWSAACSQGQELYSVALMLAELELLGGSHVLGTDCRMDAIEQAREGEYAAAELKGVSPDLHQAWFHAVENRPGCFNIDPRLRCHTRWKAEDLLTSTQPGPWDIILWRNHAIYLRIEAAAPLWDRLTRELRPGGLLITGRAERPDRSLPLVRVAACIYRKV